MLSKNAYSKNSFFKVLLLNEKGSDRIGWFLELEKLDFESQILAPFDKFSVIAHLLNIMISFEYVDFGFLFANYEPQ